jgi:hypothetical protein
MSVTLFHAPSFYVVASAVLAICFSSLWVVFWSGHRILALLRDWREFRRGN